MGNSAKRREKASVAVDADAAGIAELIGSVPGMGTDIGDLINGVTVEGMAAETAAAVADESLRREASYRASREREVAARRRKSGGLRSQALAEDSERRAMALGEIAGGGVSSLARAAEVAGVPSIGGRRSDVEAILASAGVEMGVPFTRRDTADMLAALLSCGEEQLERVMADPRTPMAVKTVVRRLCADYRDGSTATIERLWDRIFGKGPLCESQGGPSQDGGRLPSAPVSRQAYELIRVRFLGEGAKDE